MDRLSNLKMIPRFPGARWGIQNKADGKKTDSDTESLADTSVTTQLPTINVVLFGETGVGKSSVINLIAQRDVAEVSSNVDGCTMHSTRYIIPVDGLNFAIFDTIGLEEPQYGVNGYLKAIEKAYELIMKLSAAGGIHLLLFCMRGGRITATTQSNYRLFCECLCSTRVPIALVFTGLEREEEMEDWWMRNSSHIQHYGIKSNGHACITAVRDDTPGEDLKFTESQKRIRDLLKDCALKNEAFTLDAESWFAKVGKGMRSFIAKHRSPKKRDVLKVLIQRCKLDPDTAKRIAEMMEKDTSELKDGSGGTAANPPATGAPEEDRAKEEEEEKDTSEPKDRSGGTAANPPATGPPEEDGAKEEEEKDGPPLHEPSGTPGESKDANRRWSLNKNERKKDKAVPPESTPTPALPKTYGQQHAPNTTPPWNAAQQPVPFPATT